MLDKTRAVLKYKKEKKNRLKNEINKQKNQLKQISLYQAKLSHLLKELNLVLELCGDKVESGFLTVDKAGELIMEEFRFGKELADYNVKKNDLNYELSLIKLDF